MYRRLAFVLFSIALVTAACTDVGKPGSLRRTRTFRNVSPAMEPTLGRDQPFTAVLFADSATAVREVRRGDLVVYAWPPDTSKAFIKRVVGIPGDTLRMVRGALRVNGKEVKEPYAWHALRDDPASPESNWMDGYRPAGVARTPEPTRNNWGPVVVPSGAFFVLGDNRDNSLDSRYWGFVYGNHLIGRQTRPAAQ
jgi:signal peptidase I